MRLDETQARLGGVKNKVERERQELAVARASVNDLARGVYMSGGMDTTIQVLLAENPTDFLAQSAALDQVAQSQSASMRRTQTAQLRLAQSEAELKDKEGLAQGYRDDMAAAKASAEPTWQCSAGSPWPISEQCRLAIAFLAASLSWSWWAWAPMVHCWTSGWTSALRHSP